MAWLAGPPSSAQQADHRCRKEKHFELRNKDDRDTEQAADQQAEKHHYFAAITVSQNAADKPADNIASGHGTQHQADFRQPHPKPGSDKQGEKGIDEIGA